jgi:hypothetical protein
MILVDAHVHIHDCFDLEIFLDSAFENFKAEAALCGQENSFVGLLLLTETAKNDWFRRLTGYADDESGNGSKSVDHWAFHSTKESCSLYAQSRSGQRLFVIAGRQIETAEGLELLALITDWRFQDGRPLKETIQDAQQIGAIPVVPWGFGKWIGRRGLVVKLLLENKTTPGLFLGDNCNRPSFWPRPHLFELAETNGRRILPGSDPLPFPSQVNRAGSFGFSMEESITPEYPARDLKQILLRRTTRIKTYGHLEHPWRFIRNQVAMVL